MSVSATVIHPQQGAGLHHETLDKVDSVHPQQATVLHFETRDNVHAFTRSQRPIIRGSSKIGIQCQCPQRSSTHNSGVVSIMRHGTMSTAFIRPQQATVLHLETHDNVHAFTRSQSPVLRGSSDLRQQSTALHLETHDNVHSVHPPTAARPLFPTLRHGTTSTAFIHPQQATVPHLETRDNVHAFTRSQCPDLRGSSDTARCRCPPRSRASSQRTCVWPPTLCRARASACPGHTLVSSARTPRVWRACW